MYIEVENATVFTGSDFSENNCFSVPKAKKMTQNEIRGITCWFPLSVLLPPQAMRSPLYVSTTNPLEASKQGERVSWVVLNGLLETETVRLRHREIYFHKQNNVSLVVVARGEKR